MFEHDSPYWDEPDVEARDFAVPPVDIDYEPPDPATKLRDAVDQWTGEVWPNLDPHEWVIRAEHP